MLPCFPFPFGGIIKAKWSNRYNRQKTTTELLLGMSSLSESVAQHLIILCNMSKTQRQCYKV